jgi:hypothetical protein
MIWKDVFDLASTARSFQNCNKIKIKIYSLRSLVEQEPERVSRS